MQRSTIMNAMQRALAIGGIGILGAVVGFYGSKVVSKIGSQTKHYGIKLVPQGGGVLKVDESNQCANNRNPHEGCLLFETDKVGQIKFYLPGSKFKLKKCEGPGSNLAWKRPLWNCLRRPELGRPDDSR